MPLICYFSCFHSPSVYIHSYFQSFLFTLLYPFKHFHFSAFTLSFSIFIHSILIFFIYARNIRYFSFTRVFRFLNDIFHLLILIWIISFINDLDDIKSTRNVETIEHVREIFVEKLGAPTRWRSRQLGVSLQHILKVLHLFMKLK